MLRCTLFDNTYFTFFIICSSYNFTYSVTRMFIILYCLIVVWTFVLFHVILFLSNIDVTMGYVNQFNSSHACGTGETSRLQRLLLLGLVRNLFISCPCSFQKYSLQFLYCEILHARHSVQAGYAPRAWNLRYMLSIRYGLFYFGLFRSCQVVR